MKRYDRFRGEGRGRVIERMDGLYNFILRGPPALRGRLLFDAVIWIKKTFGSLLQMFGPFVFDLTCVSPLQHGCNKFLHFEKV